MMRGIAEDPQLLGMVLVRSRSYLLSKFDSFKRGGLATGRPWYPEEQ